MSGVDTFKEFFQYIFYWFTKLISLASEFHADGGRVFPIKNFQSCLEIEKKIGRSYDGGGKDD